MNRKKKLFSLLLVVVMIVTTVSTNVFSAFAEESVDNITEENNQLSITLTKKDGSVLGGDNSASISNGDDVIINLNFKILQDNVGKPKLCIDLSKLAYIKDLIGGTCFTSDNSNVGQFTIDRDTVYIEYDWDKLKECYPNSSEYQTTVSINAKANYSDSDVDSDGNIKFVIKDHEYVAPNIFPDSDVAIEKVRLGDGDGNNDNVGVIDGETYQKFQVKATSKGGNNTNVVIKDTLHSSNLSFVENGNMAPTMTKGNQTVNLNENNFSVNDQTAIFTVGDLDKDEEAIITYWVKIDAGAYFEGTDKRSNTVEKSFKNNNDRDINSNPSSWTEVKVNNIYVDKYAQDKESTAGKKKVEWTISVTGGDVNTGYKFNDHETGSGDIEHGKLLSHSKVLIKRGDQVIGEIPYDQLNSLTIGDKDDLNNNQIKLGKGEKLTLTYTNTYKTSDVDISVGYDTKNKVDLEKPNYPTAEKEVPHTVVPKLDVSIKKSCTNYDVTNKRVTWKIEVKVPADFTNLKLTDFVGQGHTMILDSLKVNGVSKSFIKNEDGTYFVDLTGIENYKVDGSYHKYTFIYDTEDLLSEMKLDNKAIISYEYNGTPDSKEDKASYDKNPIISKEGNIEWVNGNATGVQIWEVKFNLQVLDLEHNTLLIKDTLPENLELIKDSFELDHQKVDLETQIDGQVFNADVTTLLKNYMDKNPDKKDVVLTYRTRIIDLSAAVEWKNLTNKIIANYNGKDASEKDKTSWIGFNPGSAISKKIEDYDIQKPTTLSYTIEVNKTATQLASDDQTQLQVVDALGSALKYNENGVKIVKIDSGWKETDITNTCKVEIDHEKNTMTIDVPDKTYLKITYTCQINLPSGTKIDDSSNQELKDSVSNKVTLQGTRNLNYTENKVFKGEVKSAFSTTHPTNCSLQINKVDSKNNQKKLEGATFKIYMVKVVNGKFVEVKKDEVHSYGGPQIQKTDENGKLVFTNLMFDQYYCYEETDAPVGYTGNVKGYVLFDGEQPKKNVENEIPAGTNLQRVYNFIGSIAINAINEKVDTGKLVITKTISGINTKEVKSAIKFKVTNANDSSKESEYTLNDFKYNESSKKWELELNKEVGEYIVEETASSVDGYTVKTTYKVNSSATANGNETNVKVENDKETAVEFKNSYELVEHDVEISKIDAVNSQNIAGAKLQILDKDNKEVARWTSVEGKIHKLKLVSGTYTLVETEAPYGYKIADPIQFVVIKDGKIKIGDEIVNKVTMKDTNTNGKLIITKTISDNITKEDIKDKIKFVVKDNMTNVFKTYKLDDFEYDQINRIWKKELDVVEGGYTVEEIVEDSTGYQLASTSYQVTQDNIQQNEVLEKKNPNIEVKDNQETIIAFKNSYTPKPYEVDVSKQDLTNEKEIAGATLKIVNQKTKEEVASWVSEKDKTHTVSLPFGEYILIEEVVPDGYKKADDIDFKVSKNGEVSIKGKDGTYSKTNKVIMKDEAKAGKLVISKSVTGSINKEQAEKVISFKVTNNSTKEVNTYSLKDFNYDESNKKWTKELIQVAGGYKVEELVTSIKGHKLSLTQYQINENGEIKEKVTDKIAEKVTVKKDKTTFIEFENNYDLNVFDVEIDKTDISGTKEVDGAKLKVIDEEGNLVERWTSGQDDEKTHKLKLSPGKYTLIEEKAPYGYRVADPIDFTVNENGKIEGMSENKITMKDEKTQAKLILTKTIEGDISKKDAQKITFKVTNQKTNKVDKYTLDDFSYDEVNKIWTKELDVLAGEYTVEETNSSIEGYTVKTTYIINGQEVEGQKTESIQIEDQGEGNVAFKNSYTPKLYEVSIRKQDILNNEDIEGANLQIQNKDTGEIISIDSSKDGQKVNLGYGNYILTEITAPDGYKIANPIEFVVTKDGKVKINDKEVNEVIMKDQPIGKLVITKTIQGNLSKEQIGDSIKFEVTQNDTQKSHIYSLNDFIYDGNRWILELEENTGGYTVKELVDDIHGYTLVKTIYMIENEINEGKSVDVDVEKGTTATVAFENTYELTTYDVKIDKVDKENDEKIAGAELKVINQANEEIAHWITDGKNSYNLKLVPGTYTLIEVNAPKGYEIAKPMTFVVGEDGKVVDYQNNKIIMKDKAKPGKLVIAKIVKGNISKEQAEKSIKFEVIDKDTQDKKVYSLNDFEYDENSGKWMLELTKVAGKYTVKELTDDVQGYKLTHIVSIIDGKEKGDVAANLNVEKDETTTIEYTNNYEENKVETKEKKSDQTPKQESKKAKTGDDTQILENLMLLISSLGGILFGLRFYRRKNEF